jgi:putative redox protein
MAGEEVRFMVRIEVVYQGGLRCQATHGPSGQNLLTDAPLDNHGKGESFSPTDLVAAALATCIPTIMGIYAEREGISLDGLRIRVDKIMSAAPPRRIARCELSITMPAGLSAKQRRALECCVQDCPVRRSMHPDVELPVSFRYPDEPHPG